MLTWLDGISNTERGAERELRARAAGAVHARRRPRLHRARRARAGARAHRLARRLARGRRAAPTSGFDRDAPRPRPQADLRPPRRATTGATPPTSPSRHPRHPRFFVTKLWSYFIPTPPPPRTRRGARAALPALAATTSGPVVAAILRHPALYDRPADGQAADRLHRRAAARARPRDRHRRLVLAHRDDRPDAVRAAQRRGLGRRRAGSTPATWRGRWMVANYALEGRDARPGPGQTRHPGTTRRAPARRSPPRPRFWGHPTLSAATRTRAARASPAGREAGAPTQPWKREHLRDPAPERAADADRDLARPAYELMAHHCRDYSRSRGAARRPPGARRCRRSSPGCRSPAGTGLSRRAFLLRSAGARAVGLRRGQARAARGARRRSPQPRPARAGARAGVPRRAGIDSVSFLAPTEDDAYRRLRPKLALPPGTGTAFSRGPAAALASRPRPRSPRCTPRARSSVMPAVGYEHPDQSHFVSRHFYEVGALDPRLGDRLARALPRPRRRARQPAPGPRARLLARARARDRPRARSPPSTSPGRLRLLGARRLGRRRDADARRAARIGAAHAARRRARCARPAAPRCRPARCARSSRRSAPEDDTPAFTSPVAYPSDPRTPTSRERLAALAAMLAAGLPLRCVAITRAGRLRHARQPAAEALDGPLKLACDALARVPARPRGARARRPRADPRVVGVRPPRRGERDGHRPRRRRARPASSARAPRGGWSASSRASRPLDEDGNLRATSDFRGVYAALLEQWLGHGGRRASSPTPGASRARSSSSEARSPRCGRRVALLAAPARRPRRRRACWSPPTSGRSSLSRQRVQRGTRCSSSSTTAARTRTTSPPAASTGSGAGAAARSACARPRPGRARRRRPGGCRSGQYRLWCSLPGHRRGRDARDGCGCGSASAR